LDSLSFTPDDTKADTTTFECQGAQAHLVAERVMTLRLAGKWLEDLQNGNRDAGQLIIEELGAQIGEASLGQFKLTTPGGKYRTFAGSVKMGDIGGGNNDPTSWNCEITSSGGWSDWT
jgi:hypothetical protein